MLYRFIYARMVILLAGLCLGFSTDAAGQDDLVFVCGVDNGLYRVVSGAGKEPIPRFDSAKEAVDSAPKGAGVLILAAGYPETPTQIDPGVYKVAAAKQLRLYIEYPSDGVLGLSVGEPEANALDRLVVTINAAMPSLQRFDILDPHEAVFVPVRTEVDPAAQWLALAKVAGYDRAVFEFTGAADPVPALFEFEDQVTGVRALVATTALSNILDGRYAPTMRWQMLWEAIFAHMGTQTEVRWQPIAHTRYAERAELPAEARVDAVKDGIAWYAGARLLIHPDWLDVYDQRNPFPDARIHQPWIDRDQPVGDGSLGVLEGTANPLYPDGRQALRWYIRSDVVAPSAMAFALHARLNKDSGSQAVAHNLIGFLSSSRLGDGPRADPDSITYGMRGWNASLEYNQHYWSDDVARVQLGQIVAASALGTDEYDERLATQILSLFRLTGTNGFWRGNRYIDAALQGMDWRELHDGTPDPAERAHPHFEAYKLACFLWLYDKTGHEPLLERSRIALGYMVKALQDGTSHWTNGIQQERARMILPLAWLVRVDDTPEHRAWLKYAVDLVLENQQPCGGIVEEVGEVAGGFPPPASNDLFGVTETPVIQENGDPGVDLLYTTNFAFKGLIEAAAVLEDPQVDLAVQRLADFLVRIQIESEVAELDGQWLRGFDFEKWEYWGSDSDAGWGIWGNQAGWTQAEIVSGLALLEMDTTAWDLTRDSKVKRVFPPVLAHMFELEHEAYDLNFDGEVNDDDLTSVLKQNLGEDISRYSAIVRPSLGDLDLNGVVDQGDVQVFTQRLDTQATVENDSDE